MIVLPCRVEARSEAERKGAVMGMEIINGDSEMLWQERQTESLLLEPGVIWEHIGDSREGVETQETTDRFFGSPEKDAENWHLQVQDSSCAICCQEFVAEQLLGEDFSEENMSRFATERGWYDPEMGTTMSDVGKLLEAMGLRVERSHMADLSEVAGDLESGGKVMCAVCCEVLANPDLDRCIGLSANHMVQVTGIDATNPADIKVILNDPGVENGKGRCISAKTFLKSWKYSGNYAVSTWKGDEA